MDASAFARPGKSQNRPAKTWRSAGFCVASAASGWRWDWELEAVDPLFVLFQIVDLPATGNREAAKFALSASRHHSNGSVVVCASTCRGVEQCRTGVPACP